MPTCWNIAFYIIIAIVLLQMLNSTEGWTSREKKNCERKANKKNWGKFWWTRRIQTANGWKCPSGWDDTGCTWNMDLPGLEGKQCRLKKSKRASKEGSTCKSNKECSNGRKCSYSGFCHDKDSVESPNGQCKRNDQCNGKRKCKNGRCYDPDPAPAPAPVYWQGLASREQESSPAPVGKGTGSSCSSNSECSSNICGFTSHGRGSKECKAPRPPSNPANPYALYNTGNYGITLPSARPWSPPV
jgi:hypothetical protein